MTNKPVSINQIWAASGTLKTVAPAKYDQGWVLEVLDFGHMNTVQKELSEAIAHNNEQGINVHDTLTVYPQDAYVKAIDGHIYRANVASTGDDPTASIKWDKWGQEFDAGVTLPFYMVAAPLNYVQDVTINNHMLVADSSGGSTAGINNPIAAHSHVVNAHQHSTGGATLTTGQLPSFQLATGWGSQIPGPYGVQGTNNNLGSGGTLDSDNYNYLTSPIGSNQPHYHGNTGAVGAGTSVAYTPKHAKVIICTRQ